MLFRKHCFGKDPWCFLYLLQMIHSSFSRSLSWLYLLAWHLPREEPSLDNTMVILYIFLLPDHAINYQFSSYTRNRITIISKSNQIRDPVLDTPEPIQKSHPWNCVLLEPSYVLKSVLVIALLGNGTNRMCVSICVYILFSRSVMSDSLQPHRLQHGRLPCPSPSPRACSNSCPLSWWCHPTISSSVVTPFSYLQSFPASGSFLMN